jgi:hypothetical protein
MVSPQMPAWHEQETFDPRPAELPHWPVIAVIDGARTVRSQIVPSGSQLWVEAGFCFTGFAACNSASPRPAPWARGLPLRREGSRLGRCRA